MFLKKYIYLNEQVHCLIQGHLYYLRMAITKT